MTGYELYIFCLCLIVFVTLTTLLIVMLSVLLKQGYKLIRYGHEDARIIEEYRKEAKKKPAEKVLCTVVVWLIVGILLVGFSLSLYIHIADERVEGAIAVHKVVMSDSMAYQRESNTYLQDNQLKDQFRMFDLIFLHELPDEFDLKLYDVVVYEYQDSLIVHLIIGIEEPDDGDPQHRRFLLRGDALKYSDEFPVMYDQMRAIYKGERIPFVGSFFAFMQSPAGYLCILLILFAVIATPIAEKKLWQAKLDRLRVIGEIPPESEEDVSRQREEILR